MKISKKDIQFTFKVSHIGEWNQVFLICDCCGESFKDDGIVRHLINKSKIDSLHKEWLDTYVDKQLHLNK